MRNIEEIQLLVASILTKIYGEDKRNSFEGLPAEFYRIEPDEYDGTLYTAGAFSQHKDVWVSCGSVEFDDDSDGGDDTAIYAIYTTDLSLCYVTLVTNDKLVFCYNLKNPEDWQIVSGNFRQFFLLCRRTSLKAKFLSQ